MKQRTKLDQYRRLAFAVGISLQTLMTARHAPLRGTHERGSNHRKHREALADWASEQCDDYYKLWPEYGPRPTTRQLRDRRSIARRTAFINALNGVQ